MVWNVLYKASARKDLKNIPFRFRQKIFLAIENIKTDPLQGKKLQGEFTGLYSFRVWPYRIIYKILKEEIIIVIVHIGHRQGVYH